MNKSLILLALLALSFLVKSQDSKRFRMGYEISGLVSQVGGDNTAGFRKIGFGAGITSTLVLQSENKFKFGITYIQKGSRVYEDFPKGIESYRLAVNYIEVPLIWEMNLFEKWFEFGLSASKALSLTESRNRIEFLNPESAKIAELGLIAGYKHSISNNKAIHLRYGNSITPFRDHPGGNTFRLNLGQMHHFFQFTFSQSFGG